ncbi:endospore germination permease [Alkalihalobacillus oceani]|uniref:GerAB/ArcD/ProY family transporter n=1 Tax=Halalkalibacter oceani TaxID=1653776 RepID=UPI002040CA3A|nr:endospore germination permease [Halalkalibacter oceani]MCM3761714.1 endospore germination permease [Halalkalibacter oceani]
MKQTEKIDGYQFTVLVALFIMGSTILVLPSALVEYARQDAWLAGVIAVSCSPFLAYLYLKLHELYPQLMFVDMIKRIVGTWAGTIVAIVYFLFSILLSSMVLRDTSDFLQTQMLPETPMYALQILLLAAVIVALLYGIETMARGAELFFPIVVLVVIAPVLLTANNLEFSHLKPFLGNGVRQVVDGSLLMLSIPFLELVLFLPLLPAVNKTKRKRAFFIAGVLVGGLIIFTIAMVTLLTIGANLTAALNFPSFFAAKKIRLGDFLQRIEAVIAVQWIITSFVKIAILMYISLILFKQIVRLQRYHIFVVPMSFIVLALSHAIPVNTGSIREFAGETWIPVSLFLGLFVPLFLYIVGLIRKKASAS